MKVYFPAGTYLVRGPIIDYYQTQLVGNPNCLPVIKASTSFDGGWIIDGDPYQPSGSQGWLSTNIFWRQIRNFVFDTTAVDPSTNIRAIHWPTGQASSLQNIVFRLSTASGTQHEGLFIENGSGGLLVDLVFYGGLSGANLGNQQFTVRNLTFYDCSTAILHSWNWGWTYQGLSINGCGTGIDISGLDGNAHAVGSIVLIDSAISNTPVGIKTVYDGDQTPGTYASPSIVLENVIFENVPIILQNSSHVIIQGPYGSSAISAWAEGHAYTPTGPESIQGPISPNAPPSSMLSSNGRFYSQSKPQYASYPVTKFVSSRAAGAQGDGTTDDTAALQAAVISAVDSGKVLLIDAGTYKITSTLYIPAGSKIVGETYSVIMASGSFFGDQSDPQPVVKVGKSGESGHIEWSDMIVSTQGPTAGAVLIEWNLASVGGDPSGMWDVHTRIGGTAGSGLQVSLDTPSYANVCRSTSV
jgi:glucan 1,3-beta-glucosidase